MLLISWNVNFRKPGDLTAKIKSELPDIVTLHEVTLNLVDDGAAHLRSIGLGHHYWSGMDGRDEPYQCPIASRWKVKPDDIYWRRCAPFLELLGRATVCAADEGEIDVFTARIPNGSDHGWKKIDTFHVLLAFRFLASSVSCVSCFNDPNNFSQS